MTIGERIIELIRVKGMTQKEFSERTGIPESTISDWKKKKTNPISDKILTISSVLGVNAYDLLSSSDGYIKNNADYVFIDPHSDEYVIIETYRQLDDRDRNRFMGYVEALKK